MNFGAALKKARKEAGISQESLAATVGVVRQTIYEWERNDKTPQLDRLPEIAAALDLSASRLIEMAEEEEEPTHLPPIGPRPRIEPGIPQRRPVDQPLNRAAKDD